MNKFTCLIFKRVLLCNKNGCMSNRLIIFCCTKNSSLDEVGYLRLFLTLPDCIIWKLRCKVHKNPFYLTWFSLRAKLTKMLSCKLHCSETEQIRWSNREDWGGWWFGRHSSNTASPHHTPRKKRYSSTTEHDTGAHCGTVGCANTGWSWKHIWTGNYL